jgi:pantothenate kinase
VDWRQGGKSLRRIVWERLVRADLCIDRTEIALEIEWDQVEAFYHPLATDLLARAVPGNRLMVAVAGPPGSGKTAFATILVAVINAEAGDDVAVLVGLDGWHFPNDYLETHHVEQDGEKVALRSIKGSPETFDVLAASDCLAEMRRGGAVSFPVYSRELHDPVPGGGMVEAFRQVVVVEGNFLLLDQDPWNRLRQLFDVCVFISASPEILVKGLRERHLRGGKTLAATDRQIFEVDLPNAKRVAPGVVYAQVLVHKANVRRIDRIEQKRFLP